MSEITIYVEEEHQTHIYNLDHNSSDKIKEIAKEHNIYPEILIHVVKELVDMDKDCVYIKAKYFRDEEVASDGGATSTPEKSG